MRIINLFETVILMTKVGFAGSLVERFSVNQGSRLFFSLNVKTIDPGASVAVRVKNGFSADFDFDERLAFSLSAVGIKSRSLSDIHNLFDLEVEVTGGNADFAIGVSVADNAQTATSGSGDTTPPPSDLAGVGVFFDSSETITPGSSQDLIDEDVPVGIQRQLSRLKVSCRFEGFYQVLVDGELAGSGRTGPANVDSEYKWDPVRPVEPESNIKVQFTARAGAPATASVEAHLQCVDVDSVG